MVMCDLVFLSRYMRPEGPWQRRSRCRSNGGGLFYLPLSLIPCARTGLTGHSGPPTPPLHMVVGAVLLLGGSVEDVKKRERR